VNFVSRHPVIRVPHLGHSRLNCVSSFGAQMWHSAVVPRLIYELTSVDHLFEVLQFVIWQRTQNVSTLILSLRLVTRPCSVFVMYIAIGMGIV